MKRSAIFLPFLFLLGGLLTAQVRTGNIMGQVALEDGTAIPGVMVTLTSPQTAKLVAISSENGNYRFLSLPPGKDYELVFELEGFKRFTQKGIRVAVGDNVTVNAVLITGNISEEVEVTGKAPVIDTRKTTASVNITQETLKSLPTARDPWSILEMVPGMMMDRQNVGGNESGQQSYFAARGEGRSNSQWNVDGVDVTDPTAPGASGIYYDFDMFEEMQIQTAANDVTAMTGGVNVNFVTKRGTNKLHGGAHFFWTGDALQSDNLPESLELADLTGNLIDKNTEYGLNFGGPILKDKIWFWGSYGVQDINLIDTIGDKDATLLKTINAKFNFHLGKHRIELYGVYNDKVKEGRKRYALDHYEASRKQTGPSYIFKLQDEISLSNSTMLSLKLSYTPMGYKLEPYGGRDVPCYEEYGEYRWNTGVWYENETESYAASLQVDHFADKFLGGDHEIKFGVDYRDSTASSDSQFGNGLQVVTYENEGYYVKLWREVKFDYYSKRLSAFLQDTFNVKNMTLLLGLRYDRQKIGSKDTVIPGTSLAEFNNVGGVNYNWPETTQKGIEFPSTFDFISPRIGLTWDLGGNGKDVLKANWAIYGSVLDSGYLSNFWPDSSHTLDWYDNGDLIVSANELEFYRTRDNLEELNSIDPSFYFSENLKPEKDMEFLLGYEKELFEDAKIGLNLIYRHQYDLNWEVPYVWDGDDLRLVQASDWSRYEVNVNGKTYYYWDTYDADVYDAGVSQLQRRPDYTIDYKALELSFRKAYSHNWMLSVALTLQDTTVDYGSRSSYIDPTNLEPFNYFDGQSGPHSLDDYVMNSRWMLKINWMNRLPWDFHFSGKIVAREGYIFPKIATLVDEDWRYWDEEKPVLLLEDFGDNRYPTFFQLDLRLDKTFDLKKLGQITLSLEGFNITNSNVALRTNNDLSFSTYNIDYVILNPRVFRLGVRYEF